MIDQFIFWGFVATLVGAALEDIIRLRISNIFPVLIVALFAAHLIVTREFDHVWQNLIIFMGLLGLGLFLFARHWLGGGDVKLLAAAGLWFNFSGLPTLLLWVTLGGGVLALGFIVVRRFIYATPNADGKTALARKGPIPYGLAIAGGTIANAIVMGINPHL